jgi:hypothetical protein
MGTRWQSGAWLIIGAAIAALSSCAGPQMKNPAHPEYGQAEYQKDLADCRKAHSHMVQIIGYDDTTKVVVDEPAVKSCIAERGWVAGG